MKTDSLTDLLKGDKVALSRAISSVENRAPGYVEILNRLFPHGGKAFRIGITGPPGAGKSTLVDRITSRILELRKKIGIIAVDPTSPFSGGALLGDRVRMGGLATRADVFIRSMATRGSLGGLATATEDVSILFDAYGMDYVITETIGVGQVELDIADACDTTVVVLVPESGDSIQAMKAGLMEIADVIAVNKADRQGADQMIQELEFISQLRKSQTNWRHPILPTEAVNDRGVDELWKAIHSHRHYLEESGDLEANRRRQTRSRVKQLLEAQIRQHLERELLSDAQLDGEVAKILRREASPFQVAEKLFEHIRG
jgi:LAO/AO transport system kinase